MSTNNHLILSSTSLTGTKVKNATDNKLGKIEDLMIDTRTGAVVYAVLSVSDGFLGLSSKYFAIPLEAFSFDTAEEEAMLLNVDKSKLESAPGFDKDNWPDNPQTEYIDSIYSHFGYRPYRERFRD